MNLVGGKIIDADECAAVLDTLDKRISKTLSEKRLDPFTVIDACDKLSQTLSYERHGQEMAALGLSPQFAEEYIADAKLMLGKVYLTEKLYAELGYNYGKHRIYTPVSYDMSVDEQIVPLGVLFHIAAGNSDGLPVFTVIEGLLAGNINILKLPREEGGVSVRILQELFNIQPELADYVYVFDYSSNDTDAMKKLAALADAVVVWGGDAAVSAVRNMAAPNTKIIEWGHKTSFAYITKRGMALDALEKLAENICRTNQLLCSSCQGIFVDTDSMEDIYNFCKRFLPLLEKACKQYPPEYGIEMQAHSALRLYNETLESVLNGGRVFKGDGCGIAAYEDSGLEPALMFRNIWVRRLTRRKIIADMRPYKNYLQTVALVCHEAETDELTELFWKTSAVRIADGAHMSKTYCGAAHDGEYPLRRYTKNVVREFRHKIDTN